MGEHSKGNPVERYYYASYHDFLIDWDKVGSHGGYAFFLDEPNDPPLSDESSYPRYVKRTVYTYTELHELGIFGLGLFPVPDWVMKYLAPLKNFLKRAKIPFLLGLLVLLFLSLFYLIRKMK